MEIDTKEELTKEEKTKILLKIWDDCEYIGFTCGKSEFEDAFALIRDNWMKEEE